MAIVTISRQVGSNGDEIAALVARKCKHQLVGRDEVHKLAQSCDAGFKDACALYEKETQPGFFERLFFNNPSYTSLFESLNFELASRGDVIIIGRGAQVVLRDMVGVIKVRVVAPTRVRIQRVAQKHKIDMGHAAEFVDKYDHQRKSLIRTLFDKDLRDWGLYDLIINTANFTPEGAADIVCQAIDVAHYEHTQEALKAELERRAFAKRVESAIKKEVVTSPYRDITVSVDNENNATLNGYVQDKLSRERAEKVAKKFERIKDVNNDIRTTELSY